MRTFKYATALLIAALALYACDKQEKPEPVIEPEPSVEDFSLTITEQNIQQTSAEFLVEPSSDEIPYIVANFAFDEIFEKDDSAIVASILSDDKLNEKIHAKQTVLKYADLNSGTDYALIAFSYYKGEAGKVIKHSYSTLHRTPDELTVDIDVANITTNSVTVTMIPNDDEIQYFGRVVTEHELTIFARTEEEAIQYLLSNPNHVKYLYMGKQVIDFQNLQPGEAQVAVAFAYEAENPKLFAKKFITDKSNIETEFTITNLQESYKSVDMHVTPAKDELYMETTVLPDYFDDPKENVMLGAYFGMQNAAVVEGITLPEYMKKYGFRGEQDITINHHSQFDMEPGCEYVTYFYYVDPENTDPTNVYDWNYTAVRYRTLEPDAGEAPKVELISVEVVKSDNGEITFHAFVHSNDNVSSISWGPALYDSKWDQYLASEGWAGVADVYKYNRKEQDEEVLEKTKTEKGYEYVWGPYLPEEDYGGGDVIFHVEGLNSQGTKCYTGVIFNENGIVEKEVKE